jgi:integration host factor subunit alpha
LATEKQRGTLTRQDIALAVFDRCEGLSRRQCKRLVDCIIAEMAGALIQGDTLKLHDFGSFVVRNRRERTGRNPRTGGSVPIQSSRSVVFKASPNMKLIVNGGAPHRKPRSTAKAAAEGASPLQFTASPSE